MDQGHSETSLGHSTGEWFWLSWMSSRSGSKLTAVFSIWGSPPSDGSGWTSLPKMSYRAFMTFFSCCGTSCGWGGMTIHLYEKAVLEYIGWDLPSWYGTGHFFGVSATHSFDFLHAIRRSCIKSSSEAIAYRGNSKKAWRVFGEACGGGHDCVLSIENLNSRPPSWTNSLPRDPSLSKSCSLKWLLCSQ